ncbi:uncharacterized protein LOC117329786 isoform X2 [Pecten maximus]|uniref:uncharacterized protein LOC117329786 isoform X1 n=1 Tax=Pecten maximus TaxID=6579 RepID=UPI0014587413|nr:uncharacterized protein LOC117329786 isoform X1 [Pecten maximus]XP_033743817.1 uncharacterized protein LOC117329786 isoform X2 [Pecten maximus]
MDRPSKVLLMSLALMSAIHQLPSVYQYFTCVESEPGYLSATLNYLAGTEAENICPAPADVLWGIGTEVVCNLMCAPMTMLFANASSIGNSAKRKWKSMVSMFKDWRARPSTCRSCGTSPCQVERKRLWQPSESRHRSKTNFSERSKAMLLFNYGLELSADLTKELPKDDLYWQRKMCAHFKEEHMVLFPKCIQRQINNWFPVPR